MISLDELMTPQPFTLRPDDSAEDARLLMVQKGIRHIPILDDQGQLVGLVTHGDLLKISGHSLGDKSHQNEDRSIAIGNFMTTDVSVVDPSESLRGAALHLQRHAHGCLPVVRDGELLGIITDSDYVGIAINLLEQMEEAEPDEDLL